MATAPRHWIGVLLHVYLLPYKCQGRASRDTLRARRGWASTVIHGKHHAPATCSITNLSLTNFFAISLLDSPDRNILLDLLGPTGCSHFSGPCRSK